MADNQSPIIFTPGIFGDDDAAQSQNTGPINFTPGIFGEEEEDERGFVDDFTASTIGGFNSILYGVGGLYGLATGDFDNAALNTASANQEYIDSLKSQDLLQKSEELQQYIDGGEGFWDKAGRAVWGTVTDPYLMANMVVEQLPLMLASGGTGTAVNAALRTAGVATRTAQVAGTAAGVGTGAALNASDISRGVYEDIVDLPDEIWQGNQDFLSRSQEIGADEAKKEIALEQARKTAAVVGSISAVTAGFIPNTIERTMGGTATRTGLIRGAAGEGAQEIAEESGGQIAGNVFKREVDPTQDILEGAGQAFGQAGLLGATIGGPVSGLTSQPYDPFRGKEAIDVEREIQARVEALNARIREGRTDALELEAQRQSIERDLRAASQYFPDVEFNSGPILDPIAQAAAAGQAEAAAAGGDALDQASNAAARASEAVDIDAPRIRMADRLRGFGGDPETETDTQGETLPAPIESGAEAGIQGLRRVLNRAIITARREQRALGDTDPQQTEELEDDISRLQLGLTRLIEAEQYDAQGDIAPIPGILEQVRRIAERPILSPEFGRRQAFEYENVLEGELMPRMDETIRLYQQTGVMPAQPRPALRGPADFEVDDAGTARRPPTTTQQQETPDIRARRDLLEDQNIIYGQEPDPQPAPPPPPGPALIEDQGIIYGQPPEDRPSLSSRVTRVKASGAPYPTVRSAEAAQTRLQREEPVYNWSVIEEGDGFAVEGVLPTRRQEGGRILEVTPTERIDRRAEDERLNIEAERQGQIDQPQDTSISALVRQDENARDDMSLRVADVDRELGELKVRNQSILRNGSPEEKRASITDDDDLILTIVKLGGINIEDANANGFEPKYDNPRANSVGPYKLFRSDGLTFDGLAESLQELGWYRPEDPNAPAQLMANEVMEDIRDAVNDAQGGVFRYKDDKAGKIAELENEKAFAERAIVELESLIEQYNQEIGPDENRIELTDQQLLDTIDYFTQIERRRDYVSPGDIAADSGALPQTDAGRDSGAAGLTPGDRRGATAPETDSGIESIGERRFDTDPTQDDDVEILESREPTRRSERDLLRSYSERELRRRDRIDQEAAERREQIDREREFFDLETSEGTVDGSNDPLQTDSGQGSLFARLDEPESRERRRALGKIAKAAVTAAAGIQTGSYVYEVATNPDLVRGKAKPISDFIESPLNDKAVDALETGDLVQAIDAATEGAPQDVLDLVATIKRLMPETGKFNAYLIPFNANIGGQVVLKDEPRLEMYVDRRNQQGGEVAVLLHEALHLVIAARYRAIGTSMGRNFETLNMSQPAAREALDQWNDLWREFQRQINPDGLRGERLDQLMSEMDISTSQAYINPDEFFVRSLTNVGFQEKLQGLDYNGKTLYERFKDWVKTYLFGPDTGVQPTWLDAALTAADDVFQVAGLDASDFAFMRGVNQSRRERAAERRASESEREETGPQFRRDDSRPRGATRRPTITEEDFNTVLNRVIGEDQASRDRIVLVDGFADLPAEIQQAARDQGSDGSDVDAISHNDLIYIVRDKMKSQARLEIALMHEGTHAGVNQMFADEGVVRALNRMFVAIGGNKGFEEMIDTLGLRSKLQPYADGLQDGKYSPEMRNTIMVQEMLAYAAENGSSNLRTKVREVIGAIRDWFRRSGLVNLSKISASDISFLAKRAREEGLRKSESTSSGTPMFMRDPYGEYRQNEMGLYSNLERVVVEQSDKIFQVSKKNPDGAALGSQVLAFLKTRGLKPEESEYLDLENFLADPNSNRWYQDVMVSAATARALEGRTNAEAVEFVKNYLEEERAKIWSPDGGLIDPNDSEVRQRYSDLQSKINDIELSGDISVREAFGKGRAARLTSIDDAYTVDDLLALSGKKQGRITKEELINYIRSSGLDLEIDRSAPVNPGGEPRSLIDYDEEVDTSPEHYQWIVDEISEQLLNPLNVQGARESSRLNRGRFNEYARNAIRRSINDDRTAFIEMASILNRAIEIHEDRDAQMQETGVDPLNPTGSRRDVNLEDLVNDDFDNLFNARVNKDVLIKLRDAVLSFRDSGKELQTDFYKLMSEIPDRSFGRETEFGSSRELAEYALIDASFAKALSESSLFFRSIDEKMREVARETYLESDPYIIARANNLGVTGIDSYFSSIQITGSEDIGFSVTAEPSPDALDPHGSFNYLREPETYPMELLKADTLEEIKLQVAEYIHANSFLDDSVRGYEHESDLEPPRYLEYFSDLQREGDLDMWQNYRESVITVPDAKYGRFSPPHFDEDNLLFNIISTERSMRNAIGLAEIERQAKEGSYRGPELSVLFIEETQSDWNNDVRKNRRQLRLLGMENQPGYYESETMSEFEKEVTGPAEQRYFDAEKALDARTEEYKDIYGDFENLNQITRERLTYAIDGAQIFSEEGVSLLLDYLQKRADTGLLFEPDSDFLSTVFPKVSASYDDDTNSYRFFNNEMSEDERRAIDPGHDEISPRPTGEPHTYPFSMSAINGAVGMLNRAIVDVPPRKQSLTAEQLKAPVAIELSRAFKELQATKEEQRAAESNRFYVRNLPGRPPVGSDTTARQALSASLIRAAQDGKNAIAWSSSGRLFNRWGDDYSAMYDQAMPKTAKKLLGVQARPVAMDGSDRSPHMDALNAILVLDNYDFELSDRDQIGDRFNRQEELNVRVTPKYDRAEFDKKIAPYVVKIPDGMSRFVDVLDRLGQPSRGFSVRVPVGATDDQVKAKALRQAKSAMMNSLDIHAWVAEISDAKAQQFNNEGLPMFRRQKDGYEQENRRIRDQLLNPLQKLQRQAKKALAPGGLLPRAVFEEKIQRDNELAVVEFDTVYYVKQLEKAVSQTMGGSIDQLPADQRARINDSLAGKMDPGLPSQVRVAIAGMRQNVDSLSGTYVDVLDRQVNEIRNSLTQPQRTLLHAMLEAGDIDQSTTEGQERAAQIMDQAKDLYREQATDDDPGLRKTLQDIEKIASQLGLMRVIRGNVGEYVHRSYKAFDDPKWNQKVPDAVLTNARAYLIKRMRDAGMSDAEIPNRVEVIINDILKEGTAYGSMESFVKESKLGAKDLSILKKRKDIAPEIRALLGEYDDPRVNYAKTTAKMARLIYNTEFLDRVRDIGAGEFLFTEDDRPPNMTRIAVEGNKTLEPLNGMYAPRDVVEAFETFGQNKDWGPFFEPIIRINGAIKFGKTVLAPTTQMRNFMSASFFAVANGHFDATQTMRSISVMREYFTRDGDKGKLAYLRKLKKLGVVYDTPFAGEMMRLLEDTRLIDMNEQDLDPIRGTVKNLATVAQRMYQFGDDFWKIVGFENEKNNLIGTGMSEAEAEVEAANRIRNTYPTYSMVGALVNSLRRFPLAGTFVSFPSEIIRTAYNVIETAAKDMATPERRSLGVRRLVGVAMVSGFAKALQEMSKEIFDVSDDEEEAIRLLSPYWAENSNLVFMGRDKDGNLEYLDISFLDPYNYFKRPINAAMREQPWEESFKQSAAEMTRPFFGVDIAAGALFDIARNEKPTGGNVYFDTDTLEKQAADIASYLGQSIEPGIAGNFRRTYRAIEAPETTYGKVYTVEDETLAFFGFRSTTFNPRSALSFRVNDISDMRSEATQVLNRAIRDPNKVGEEGLAEAIERSLQMRERTFGEALRLIGAARSSGMNDQALTETLRAGGISRREIGALLDGRVPELILSPTSMRNSYRRALQSQSAEKAEQLLMRYGFSAEMLFNEQTQQ